MKNFSELLERLREAQQLSKKDLAQRANLTPGYISLLTRGERETPSEAAVVALADALHLDAETRKSFFEAAGYSSHPTPSTTPRVSFQQGNMNTYTTDKKMDDDGEAPNVEGFHGRQRELELLQKWIIDDHCRLVTIWGIGGVGKSALTAKLETLVEDKFDYVFWRSLQSAPSLKSIVEKSIVFFSRQRRVDLSLGEYEQISLLIGYLRDHRCLFVLDNFESVLESGDRTGQYRKGYEGYGKLLQRLGETTHQSCLLINSREKPKEITLLEGRNLSVRSMDLSGVTLLEAKEILLYEGIHAADDDIWKKFIELYAGNLLALKLASASVRELFGGDIALFLQEGEPIFGDIYAQLDQQFDRLSESERQVMYWLAIEGEPIAVSDLRENIIPTMPMKDLQEALNSLLRRSIMNVVENGRFSLQPAIKQYVTDRFVKKICQEIDTTVPNALERYTLLEGEAKDYVREGQRHLILEPVVKHLLDKYGQEEAERHLKNILSNLRHKYPQSSPPGYAAGNILNLLIGMHCNIRGSDFSHLTVWQAYLQGILLPEVKFNDADLQKSVFTDSFGSIHAVALSPNGEQLAAGTANGEVRVWETASGRPITTYPVHTDWVRSVAFSPDGNYLASGSDDQTICLQERKTGRRTQLAEHTGRVYAIAFSADSQQLISGSQDKTVRVWDVKSEQRLTILEGHQDRVWAVAFSNTIVASGSEDQTIRLWNPTTGQCLNILKGHTAPIWSVAFSHDGMLLASGSEDQSIRLWDITTGECLHILTNESDQSQDYTGWVRSVTFSPDGKTLISGSDDRMVRLWDITTGICRNTLRGHSNWVRSVAISLDGSVLASGSEDQTVRIWEMGRDQCRKTLQGHTTYIYAVAFSPDGKLLASSDEEQNVCLWNATNGELLKTLPGHKNWIRSLAFSPDGNYLASGSEDLTVRLWEVKTGDCRSILKHTDWIYAVAFSPDGHYLASGSEDQMIHLWNVETGQRIRLLEGHTDWVVAIDFSPNGELLASSSDDRTVRLWDVNTGQLRTTLQHHTGRIRAVSFSPNGQLLATGSEDRKICVWDVQTHEIVQILEGHTSRIRSLAFSPESDCLVSASEDKTIRFWDVRTGACVGHIQDDSRITCVTYKADGTMIATSSYDGTVKLWHAQTRTHLTTLRSDRPYEHMNITSAKGLTPAQKEKLKSLGAIETLA